MSLDGIRCHHCGTWFQWADFPSNLERHDCPHRELRDRLGVTESHRPLYLLEIDRILAAESRPEGTK